MWKKWLGLVLMLCMMASFAMGEAPEENGVLVLENGMLQPVFYLDDLMDPEYTNEGQDILRFCVWVETDADTDLDGKADLVKVLLEVPRAAAEGKYRAAVIYDPTPYMAGTVQRYETEYTEVYVKKEFDSDRFTKDCAKRQAAGSMTSLEAAEEAWPGDWNYETPDGSRGFESVYEYDYYLTRGFAVALCSGIGTYGSEGFELCGTEWERDSHKAVVEWLTGNRRAFTDTASNIEISADWCSGSVAMTGTSYGGTLPFSVAVTGVEGLKTIIPVAGIASWYDYTNSQGINLLNNPNYTDSLAIFNAGGCCFQDPEWTALNPEYGSWLWTVASIEDEDNGDYSDHYAMLDYTLPEKNHIACSALVVQGLNDFNVTTRQADLMVRAFARAGQKVSLVLHQDGHNSMNGMSVNGRAWQEIANLWLTHYLYGVENGIENLPAVLAQNNVTGRFDAYDSWLEAGEISLGTESQGKTSVITSSGMALYKEIYMDNTQNNISYEEQADFYNRMSSTLRARYPLDVAAGTTIKGTPRVRAGMSTDRAELDGLMVCATLMDVSDTGLFQAFLPSSAEEECVPAEQLEETYLYGPDSLYVNMTGLTTTGTAARVITQGWTDLQNPGCGFDSFEYVRQEGIEAEQEYEYTFYLNPVVYTLQEGHHLELQLITWDPYRVYLDITYNLDGSLNSDLEDVYYQVAINNESIEVTLPVDTGRDPEL